MYIDAKEGMITISQMGNLAAYHYSQLDYLGFSESEDSMVLSCPLSNDILRHLIEYISGEDIAFELSKSIQVLIEAENASRAKFEYIREQANEFKSGRVASKECNELITYFRENIPRRLKEHQIKAATHLCLVGNGANFSVPGSGKTSVVLSAYQRMRDEGIVNLLFVIGPPACFDPWMHEFKSTLERDSNSYCLAGGDPFIRRSSYYKSPTNEDELYLTTFQSALNDIEDICCFFRSKDVRPFLVVDEAHYIKQVGGRWAEAILTIAPLAKKRCILTGTPMPQGFFDSFNLFDILWGKDKIINSEAKIRISLAQDEGNDQQAKMLLKESISPFFYRVRKKDLNLKPQEFLSPYVIGMNEIEYEIYSSIVKRIRDYSQKDYLHNLEIMDRLKRGRMIRLRQCVSYPAMLRSVLEGYDEDLIDPESSLLKLIRGYDDLEKPAKILFLCNLVKKLVDEKKKVVIWSNFVASIDLISSELSKIGILSKCILGRTPTNRPEFIEGDENEAINDAITREEIRKLFVDPDSDLFVLVANPAACAESISLHRSCQNAIYYDLSYNCAQYLQSLDRIHRVGGSEDKKAYYHYIQYENSIDQDIKHRLELKADRMHQLIEDDYTIYSLNMFESDNEELLAYDRLVKNE